MSDDIHALSGAYAVDALDDVERARFERHLAGCSACQAEVESLVAAASELSVPTETAPPPSLRAKVLVDISTVRPLPPLPVPHTADATDTTDDTTSHTADDAAPGPGRLPASSTTATSTRPTRPTRPTTSGEPGDTPAGSRVERLDDRRRARGLTRGWRLVVAAATIAVLTIGGFTLWRQATTDPSTAIADRVLAASDSTRTAKRFPDGSTATIVRSPSLHKAVIVTTGMAQPPNGKVYQLWLQDPTGHMASAGVMPPGADEVVVLDGDASKATGAGITVEPAGGSGQPTSAPIALFSFA